MGAVLLLVFRIRTQRFAVCSLIIFTRLPAAKGRHRRFGNCSFGSISYSKPSLGRSKREIHSAFFSGSQNSAAARCAKLALPYDFEFAAIVDGEVGRRCAVSAGFVWVRHGIAA